MSTENDIEITEGLHDFLGGDDAVILRAGDFARIQAAIKAHGLTGELDGIELVPLAVSR